MPPKKDDKKGKKGGPVALKEIDPLLYVRKQAVLSDSGVTSISTVPTNLTGYVANVEQLFPEWSIDGEVWAEPIPEGKEILYPSNLKITDTTTMTKLFGLEPVEVVADPKAKKAPPPKKGVKEVEVEITEQFVNEAGKPLPVMLLDPTSTEFTGTLFPRDFTRDYSDAQLKLKNEQNALRSHIDELVAKNETDKDEHVAKQIHKLQETLRRSQLIHNMDTELPSGCHVDPYLAAAFNTVLRFAGPIIENPQPLLSDTSDLSASNPSASGLQSTFLWRAIYPQLPNGKPYYNASGRYAVKLYLAGRWRKVYVNDVIPLRADGSVALSTSSERLELWPLILAKAVYTVYSQCGYSRRFEDVNLTPQSSNPFITTIPAYKISQFTSFALHLLTAWQPSVPVSVSAVFLNERSRANGLLESLLLGGVLDIADGDVVVDDKSNAHEPSSGHGSPQKRSEPVAVDDGFYSYAKDNSIRQALRLGDDPQAGDSGPVNALKTKKQFQIDYQRRKGARDEIVKSILLREERIAKFERDFRASPMNEVYFLSIRGEGDGDEHAVNARIVPVLGVVFPDHSNSLLDIQFLVDWRTRPVEPVPEQVVSLQGIFNPELLKGRESTVVMRRDDETPLPATTPLVYEWLTVKQLTDQNAYITAVNTNIAIPYSAGYSRHWAPLTPPADPSLVPGKKEKEAKPIKDKNKSGIAPAALAADEVLCGDDGAAPVTLLVLDTSMVPRIVAAPVVVDSTADDMFNDETSGDGDFASEMQEAVRAQATELDSVVPALPTELIPASTALPEGSLTPRDLHDPADYIYMSVLIHADLVTAPAAPLPTSDPLVVEGKAGSRPPTASRPTTAGGTKLTSIGEIVSQLRPQSGRFETKPKELPSDTVVILQEVRFDQTDPLMFILDLKDECFLPFSRKTFGIPKHRLSANKDEPLLFWVRVFSRSSVFIQVNCTVKVTIDSAEKVWTALNRPFYVSEGDSSLTRENTEQLLFRMPLVAESRATGVALDTTTVSDASAPATEGSQIVPYDRQSTSPCMAFLHVGDRDVEKAVSLKVLGNEHEGDTSFSTLLNSQGNLLSLNSVARQASTLVGTVYPKKLRAVPGSGVTVAPFHWKLLLLSPGPQIVTPAVKPTIAEEAVTQRFSGRYYANHRRALFRDVFSVEKSSFPLALRLVLSPLDAVVGGSETDSSQGSLSNTDDVHVTIRMYRKADRSLVSTFSGRRDCHVYSQAIDLFLSADELSGALASPEKGKKDAKAAPPPKKGAPVVAETIDLIVECTVDAGRCDPETVARLTSRFPHNFDALYEAPSEGDPAPIATIVEGQRACLAIAPPVVAQFSWQLDVLAGKVTNVSHDISELERATARKNAWEEKSAGRTDRAAAALAYYQEGRILDTRGSGEEKGGEHASSVLTSTMIEALSVALNVSDGQTGSLEEVSERYALVRRLPKYVEFVDILEEEEPQSSVSPSEDQTDNNNNLDFPSSSSSSSEGKESEGDMLIPPADMHDRDQCVNSVHPSAAERRVAEMVRAEQRFVEAAAQFEALNARLREDVKTRVEAVVPSAIHDATEMSKLWAAREEYRVECETRNASLNYLLVRAKEAVQKAKDIENGVDDKGKKGAKKK